MTSRSDQALAEKIVEILDSAVALNTGTGRVYYLKSFIAGESQKADKFVRDPRVAMSMMELAGRIPLFDGIEYYPAADDENKWYVEVRIEMETTGFWSSGESLPRAINEACAEALSND